MSSLFGIFLKNCKLLSYTFLLGKTGEMSAQGPDRVELEGKQVHDCPSGSGGPKKTGIHIHIHLLIIVIVILVVPFIEVW